MDKLERIKNLTNKFKVALLFCGDGKTKKSLKAIVSVSKQYQQKVAEILNEKEYAGYYIKENGEKINFYTECNCEFICPPKGNKCYKVKECNNCKYKNNDTSL